MLLNITTLNNIVYEIIEQKKKQKLQNKMQTKSNTEDDTWRDKKRKNFNNRRNLLGGWLYYIEEKN